MILKEKVKVGKSYVAKDEHDILERMYELDDEKGICHLYVHLNSMDEVIDSTIGNMRVLTSDFRDRILSEISRIPLAYKIFLHVEIEDIGEEKIEDFKSILKDSTLREQCYYKVKLRRKKRLSICLLAIGILILTVMFLLSGLLFTENYQNSLLAEIVTEILDIAAWVFVWESVAVFFLDRAETKSKFTLLKRRLVDLEVKASDKSL